MMAGAVPQPGRGRGFPRTLPVVAGVSNDILHRLNPYGAAVKRRPAFEVPGAGGSSRALSGRALFQLLLGARQTDPVVNSVGPSTPTGSLLPVAM